MGEGRWGIIMEELSMLLRGWLLMDWRRFEDTLHRLLALPIPPPPMLLLLLLLLVLLYMSLDGGCIELDRYVVLRPAGGLKYGVRGVCWFLSFMATGMGSVWVREVEGKRGMRL